VAIVIPTKTLADGSVNAQANTKFFTPDLEIPDNTILFIYVAPDASGVLSLWLNNRKYMLNSGNPLNANSLYGFSIHVSKGDKVNLEYSVNSLVYVRILVAVL